MKIKIIDYVFWQKGKDDRVSSCSRNIDRWVRFGLELQARDPRRKKKYLLQLIDRNEEFVWYVSIVRKLAYARRKMAGAAENAPKQASEEVKLDLFEDDDEFEEFETEEWDDEEGEKVALQQWEEDWDDDDVNDDFSAQLRTELESASAAAETPAAS
ncbi:hypothetical protein R1sor_012899 [Riccia sorocarpa]|uniref:26S proteasome complex subunit SEM1 n=1 Tax=Riccia sorocarpa TaxID=122646 RepID=A0ABD3I538_9MARC